MFHNTSFPTFALSFLLIFVFLSNPIEKTSAIDQSTTIDIMNRTCKRCAEKSSSFLYEFCQTSLDVIPGSHVANLQGIAVISMELALENATTTIADIKSLFDMKSLSPYTLACLQDCLELYSDAVVTLVDGVAAFLTGKYHVSNVKISAVMEAAATCEEGFTQKKGEVSPLTLENFNLFNLCDIALCIIHWLTLPAPQS